jgi:hypothetical protein
MDSARIDRREALRLLGLGFSGLCSFGLFPKYPLSAMPNGEKYPVQFVAVGFEATLWLKFIVENHYHDFRTLAVDHYPLGMEQSWVDCHIYVTREENHGLPAYPETWENAICRHLVGINSELKKGKKNVIMAGLGDYFADGVASIVTASSIFSNAIPTLALVTLPSPARGKRRRSFAAQALEQLRRQRQIMPVMVVNQTSVKQALSSLIRRFSPSTV